jgi:uncharacterized protein YbjQ (UPF0145 family)
MIITTTDEIKGGEIKEVLGLIQGNTVQSRWVGSDIMAGFKNLVGGEIKGYTKLMNDSRTIAIDRMKEEAVKLGADAVVGVRFVSATVMANSAEILAYGTAVKLKK